MAEWSPEAYGRFADERARPLVDLLDLLPPKISGRLLDLGCGDGRLTRLAAARLGVDAVVGVDSSAAMLEAARKGEDGVPSVWREADLRAVLAEPDTCELVLSNAALQFVPEHEVIFPQLLGKVAPGGWVAVHMPYNHVARTHLLLEEAARAVPALDGFRVAWPQEDPDVYGRLLREAGFEHTLVQIRVYRHALQGAAGIVSWMRSAGMTPWLNRLEEAGDQEVFLSTYSRLIDLAYPSIGEDLRLLDYARLLIVGRRAGA
jgi:trans-aconitate 2-methyltransferase